jgi:ribosome-associated toxin RatA of RatAB toxin-antitoxin module
MTAASGYSSSRDAATRLRENKKLSVVEKSVLVGHSAAQMFALVDAVEAYPQFLPWCDSVTVIFRDASRTRATIHVNYHGVKPTFTTENTKTEPHSMSIRLVEGPFRILDGEWRFLRLSDAACKIEFRLHYEFSSKILEKLVGPVFAYIANTMVDAFVHRAEKVYGA